MYGSLGARERNVFVEGKRRRAMKGYVEQEALKLTEVKKNPVLLKIVEAISNYRNHVRVNKRIHLDDIDMGLEVYNAIINKE